MPTFTYNQGSNTFLGLGTATTLVPAAGVTAASINLAGVLTDWTVDSQPGASVTVNNTVAAGNTLNLNTDGGAITLDSTVLGLNALGAVNVTINGGSFSVGSSLLTANVFTSGSVAFGPAGGTDVVGTPGSLVTIDLINAFSPITGFTQTSDVIDDVSLPFTGSTTYTISGSPSDQTVVVTQGGQTFTFALNGSNLTDGTYNTLTGGPLHISADGSGGTDITVCFARGTRIATPHGDIAVEALAAGDLVSVQRGDLIESCPVKWLGERRIVLSSHPRPNTVSPVMIQRGAFANGVPSRDLLVSPDHAIYVDGKLICARQLINGSTIRLITGLPTVDYFHVELEAHSILLAEGLPTESYLDTGNRGFFANGGEAVHLHPDLNSEADYPTREAQSCAPFVWAENDVKPVWERLAARAGSRVQPVNDADMTSDVDLRIVASGKTLEPVATDANRYQFIVPAGTTDIQLISRSAAPTDVRPWMEDRRRLGAYVERMAVRSGELKVAIPVDHPELAEGWWAVEQSGSSLRRWTDGNARVPLPELSGPLVLHVWLAESDMTYRIDADTSRQRNAA